MAPTNWLLLLCTYCPTKTVFFLIGTHSSKMNSNTWDGTTNQGRGYSGNGRHEDCIYQNAGVGTNKTQIVLSFDR